MATKTMLSRYQLEARMKNVRSFLELYETITDVQRLTARAYDVDSSYGRMEDGIALEIGHGGQPERLWTVWGSTELKSMPFGDEMHDRLVLDVHFMPAPIYVKGYTNTVWGVGRIVGTSTVPPIFPEQIVQSAEEDVAKQFRLLLYDP